ncbi:MAG: hypothetical protein NC331_14520 [Lachnospiraceae bacterium]|nr:hypothetical protein [Lachnospiraceae bacterium]MCM1240577.1 hypothetical protein [Lachnospiraceae bacterium]
MAVLHFLLKYWDSVALVTAVAGFILYLIKTGQTKILKKIAIRLVTEAEGELGNGTGIFKQAAVIEWLYDKIPAVLKIFFSQRDLEKLVDTVVEEVKKKWESNADIQEYIESKQLMRLTALECGVGEIDVAVQELKPGSTVNL